ncbi:MAG: hypothetical protein HND52_07015 [Ignavibacteriae bacterium]|jgi:hypothetical protein|nr:hypothetical protein [Ignavibacteriota bacterium]NOG97694.1 hypothetical protein [Ignavibacteriota bacterium]
MTQILIVIGFFIAAFSLMAVSLHFSKYKKRDSGCCGGGNCSTDENGNKVSSCYSSKSEFVDSYSKTPTN